MRQVTIPATGQCFDLERPGSLAAWNRALNRHYGMENLRSHGNPVVRRIEARRWARIDALVGRRRFERAVDLGAEDGSLAEKWSRHGDTTLLIDVDPTMLERAKLPGAGADAAALPLAENSCDLVVLSALLEHLVDPESVARECARVVRPGGRGRYCT